MIRSALKSTTSLIAIATGVNAYSIRSLSPDDAENYRALRLEALEQDGKYFTADLAKEAALDATVWKQRCTQTHDYCAFGLFHREKLVGIMMAQKWDKDPAREFAYWGSAYIQPTHRHKSVTKQFYDARETWTRKAGFRFATFTIREDNWSARRIHESRGAMHIGDEEMLFADGRPALARWYKRDLIKLAA